MDMLDACPNHQYSTKSLVEFFVNGLNIKETRMLNAAANGGIYDKPDAEAWDLIRKIALDRQHESVRDIRSVKAVGVSTADPDPLLEKIASTLDHLTIRVNGISSTQQTQCQFPQAQYAPQVQYVQPSPPSLAMVAASCQNCNSPMHTLQNCPFTNCEKVSAMYQQRQ